MTRLTLPLLCLLACAGCATTPTSDAKKDSKSFDPATAVTSAARTPFSDLNLVREEIPESLKAAHRAPYALPADGTCAGIGKEIEALDVALGADLDTPAGANNPSLLERGSDLMNREASGALRGAVEGLIPYRSWLRKLSGAERYSRQVLAAVAAGTVRRAFLKGVGSRQECAPPASPLPPQSKEVPVEEAKR